LVLLDGINDQGVVMFGFFKTDPVKKLQNKIQKKYTESVQLQRNGNLREYAKVMKEIEELEKQYVEAVSEGR